MRIFIIDIRHVTEGLTAVLWWQLFMLVQKKVPHLLILLFFNLNRELSTEL